MEKYDKVQLSNAVARVNELFEKFYEKYGDDYMLRAYVNFSQLEYHKLVVEISKVEMRSE